MRPQIIRRCFTRQKEILTEDLTSKRQKMLLAKAKSLRLSNPSSAADQEMNHADNTWRDKIAWGFTKVLRVSFDVFSGYRKAKMNEKRYLRRFIFLETLAVVPGTVAALAKHFQMLRKVPQYRGYRTKVLHQTPLQSHTTTTDCENDSGENQKEEEKKVSQNKAHLTRKPTDKVNQEMDLFNSLLQEIQTERMHLMIFLQLKQPGLLFRILVAVAQKIFTSLFGLMYLTSPHIAHRFVAYLEEEAVSTYDRCLQDFEQGRLPQWERLMASPQAIQFWQLSETATFKDVLLAIRADEALHREMHHSYTSSIDSQKEKERKRSKSFISRILRKK